MKATRLAACSVVAVMTGFGAHAQDLPTWNPSSICAEDSTPDHCIFLESQARGQISQQWAFIPSLIREKCLTDNEDAPYKSWRLFSECFAEAASAPRQAAASGSGAQASASGDDAVETDALRAELETAKARIAELEAAAETASDDGDDAKVAELTAELDKAKASARVGEVRIEGLQQRLLAAVNAEQPEDTSEEVETLTARVAELEGQLEKANLDLRSSTVRIEGLQQRLLAASEAADASASGDEEMAAKVTDLEGQLEKANLDLRSSTVRIEGLQQRLLAASEAVDASASGDEEMTAKVTDLESKLEKATTDLRSSTVRIEGLQQRLLEASEAADASASGDDEMSAKVTDLEGKLEKATTDLRSSTVRIEGLQQRLLEASEAAEAAPAPVAENDEMARKAASLQRLFDNQKDRLERVGSRVTAQREQIASLETEIRSLRRAPKQSDIATCQQRLSDILSQNGIQFDNEKAEIRPDAARVLDRLIIVAQDCQSASITVEGHTDARGERSYNQYLSQLRADAVATYMSSNGIPANRINAVGVGPDEPIADNNTRSGRAQNRRIEFVLD